MCSRVPSVGAGKIAGGVSLLYDVEADVVHSADRAIDDAPRQPMPLVTASQTGQADVSRVDYVVGGGISTTSSTAAGGAADHEDLHSTISRQRAPAKACSVGPSIV